MGDGLCGTESASNVQVGAVRKLDSQDHGCRSSGMTVRAWCQENGLSEKTYYYWQRRLFQTLSGQQQTIRQPAFAEITPRLNVQPSGGVAVTVRISGVEAEIYNGADAVAVETVLRILKSC